MEIRKDVLRLPPCQVCVDYLNLLFLRSFLDFFSAIGSIRNNDCFFFLVWCGFNSFFYYETKTFRVAKKAQTAPIKFFVGFFLNLTGRLRWLLVLPSQVLLIF